MARKWAVRRKPGDVLLVDLGGGRHGYGRVLADPLVAFYDAQSPPDLSAKEVARRPILFKVWVAARAIKEGVWKVIGHVPLPGELLEEPWFFKKDAITGALTLYMDSTGEEVPATRRDCEGLECAAVWDVEHVVDRLRDHFAGHPNAWAESMRP